MPLPASVGPGGARGGREAFLLWFSYLGSRFAGVQRQPDNITVQGVIENAAAVLLRTSTDQVNSTVSSRTDSGVHALVNTAKLERGFLEVPAEQKGILGLRPPYQTKALVHGLNSVLQELDLEVRVLGLDRIAEGFHIRRHCLGRAYLYRLAVLKEEFGEEGSAATLQPVFEHQRSMAVDPPFEPLRAQRFADLLTGTHNFASFMGDNADLKDWRAREGGINTVRQVDSLELRRGRGLLDASLDPAFRRFDFYELHVRSHGFLYQQIRRMTAAIVGGGRGRVSDEDIGWMLANPAPSNFHRIAQPLAPPGGLYLSDIRYNPEHYLNPPPPVGAAAPEKEPQEEE